MVARLNPDRALTNAEKARRHRENHAAYVRALEVAVSSAAHRFEVAKGGEWWLIHHGDTIHRARQSLAQRQD